MRLGRELEMERLVERPRRRPARLLEAAVGDAADAPALLGQLLAARQVDARELEQRDRRSLPASTFSRAAAIRPSSSVVRRIAWSPLIGSGSRIASGSGSVATRLQV